MLAFSLRQLVLCEIDKLDNIGYVSIEEKTKRTQGRQPRQVHRATSSEERSRLEDFHNPPYSSASFSLPTPLPWNHQRHRRCNWLSFQDPSKTGCGRYSSAVLLGDYWLLGWHLHPLVNTDNVPHWDVLAARIQSFGASLEPTRLRHNLWSLKPSSPHPPALGLGRNAVLPSRSVVLFVHSRWDCRVRSWTYRVKA